MTPRVVLLLSDKRSGSTMFQREICRHPDIQTVVYSPHTYLETHHWLKAAVMLSSRAEDFAGDKIYEGYGSAANARVYMEDCIRGNLPHFDINIPDNELVISGWEALCTRFAQPVFFEKSPQYLAHWAALELIIDWIRETSFDVKIIGLVRNPLAVLYSAEQLFHSKPEKRQFGWANTYRNWNRLTKLVGQDQAILCKYEDLIDDPKEGFGKICDFIGVRRDDSVGDKVRDSSLAKWKTDPFFSIQLDSTVKAVALELGYSSEELENPFKQHPSSVSRIKKSIFGKLRLAFARFRDRVWRPRLLRRRTRSE